jgi:predicted amidophosphoribosyltransferase
MAALLDDIVPRLPEHVIIVPVPTLAVHVRQRGYDHMVLLAKAFAAIRELQSKSLLSRRTATSQRGASRVVRMHQAEQAFSCAPLQGGIYVLLDDVLTTGATAEHAARALLAAGADEVWLAIIARQPLEK